MATLPPLPPGATLINDDKQQDTGLPPLPEGASLVQPTKEEEIAAINPEDLEDVSWGDAISKGIQTSPEAIKRTVEELEQAISHPKKTLTSLANMTAGMIEKLFPGKQAEEPAADLLIDFLKDRYGTIDGFKKAIATDLPNVVSDIASVLIPGGQAARGLGTASKIKTLTKLGERVTKVGRAMDPVTAVLAVPKEVGQYILKDRGYRLYEKAANFSKSIPRETRQAVSKIAVDEAIIPTTKGLEKVRGKINILNDQISDLLERGVADGKTIPVNALFKEFSQMRKEAHILMPTEPQAFKRLMNKVAKEMHTANKKINNGKLSLTDVQRIKQNIYKDIGNYYSAVRNSPAKVAVKKAVARAAKQSLEKIFPELKQLNQQKGAYRDLLKAIDNRADAIDNSSIASIGTLSKMGIGTTAGSLVAGAPGAATGSAMGLAYSFYSLPKIKARLAVAANKLQKMNVPLGPAWSELGILARVPERMKENTEE